MTYRTESPTAVVPVLTTRLLPFELEAELRDQMQQIAGFDRDMADLTVQITALNDQRNALATRRSRHEALCIGLRTTITHITGRPLAAELQPPAPATDDYDEVPF